MPTVYWAYCDPSSGNYSHEILSCNTTAQVEGNCNNRERLWCILGLSGAYFEANKSKNITRVTEDFATYLGRKNITIWWAVEEFNIEESVVPVCHSLPMSSQHDVPDCVTAGTHDNNWWKKMENTDRKQFKNFREQPVKHECCQRQWPQLSSQCCNKHEHRWQTKLISQTADRRQVPNTERLPTPLSPLKRSKLSLCVI